MILVRRNKTIRKGTKMAVIAPGISVFGGSDLLLANKTLRVPVEFYTWGLQA